MNKLFSVFALLFFLCIAPLLQANVAPITPGEGIWNVLTRAAFAASEIEGATGCDYFISQANIPLTITTPGNYCLTESIVFSGTAVTINSSDVNFNMENYTMDAELASNSVAFLLNSGNNISIINGSIKNTTSGAILGGNALLENIVISGVDIMQSLVGIVFNNGMNVEGMLIKDCYFSNGDGITIQGSGVTVRGCELDDSVIGGGSAAITIQGVSDAHLARHVIVEDCIITGTLSFLGDNNGIIIQRAANALVDNCKLSGGGGGDNAIEFNNVSNLRCSNCSLVNTAGIFVTTFVSSTPVDSALIENCIIMDASNNTGIRITAGPLPVSVNNVVIRDCVISKPSFGILLQAGSAGLSGNVNNVSIQRCDILDPAGPGILIFTSNAGVLVKNVTVRDCVFTGIGNPGSYGLEIGPGGETPSPSNVVATGCTGQNLATAFFDQTVSSPIIMDHCIAQNCLVGFFITSTHTQIINCCSERNRDLGFANPTLALANSSFADGTAFAGVPASLIKSGAVAASNATYWNNVAF